eukprot:9653635-Lingulodinium_polyedra.AAC.1
MSWRNSSPRRSRGNATRLDDTATQARTRGPKPGNANSAARTDHNCAALSWQAAACPAPCGRWPRCTSPLRL